MSRARSSDRQPDGSTITREEERGMSGLQIVQVVLGGLPDTPFVTADEATARTEYDRLVREYELGPEEPHSDDVDVYWWEVEAV